MKTTSLILSATVLVAGFSAPAITNTTIAVSGTNLVLSWPSHGYESYLIQYRQTLDATDAWTTLVNAYPANSTNRTTFTLYGIMPLPNTNNGTGGGGGGSAPLPNGFSSGSLSARHGGTTVPLAMPADGSGAAVPLALYPPGLDLSDFVILDPATGQWLNGSGHTSALAARPMGGASPMGASEDDAGVATGFYRVFHIPDWLVSLDGYTFDGPTFLPVDFAAPDAPTNYVDDVTVLINGKPMNYTQFIPYDINGTTYWGLGIYFDRLPNGTNTIQLLTTVRQSDELDDQTPYMTFSNAPQTIVIGNHVSFPNWDDLIWNNTNSTFTAQTASNVDWEIDIYDVYGAFVNSQTGHSDNGNISWTWDLTDYLGNLRNNSDSDPVFYPYITITPNAGNSGNGVEPQGNNAPGPMPAKAASFPETGAWLISYLDNEYLDDGPPYSYEDAYYKSAMNGLAGGPELWNIPTTVYPIKFGTNYTQVERDESWDGLKQLLANPQYRNFYYHGHGGMDLIGGDITTFDSDHKPTGATPLPGSRAKLTPAYVHDYITTENPLGACFYRFVWLDGCATEFGTFPDAWGIGKVTNDLSYYSSSANTNHLRPSVFVGWHATVGGDTSWGTLDQYISFRSFWMGNWSVNNGNEQDGLSDTFSSTVDNLPENNRWPRGGSTQLWTILRVDGYRDLKFNEYNHKGDWP
jgi:hypothetical protein